MRNTRTLSHKPQGFLKLSQDPDRQTVVLTAVTNYCLRPSTQHPFPYWNNLYLKPLYIDVSRMELPIQFDLDDFSTQTRKKSTVGKKTL
jgi:hypothetical protein